MYLDKKGMAPVLKYEAFANIPWLAHGFSTRLGGVSEGHLASMNLGFGRGDSEENMLENYRRMGKAIGFQMEDTVVSKQTHTTNIRLVTEADRGKGLICERDYDDIDGLMTNVAGIALVTLYADCVPLYFVDCKNRAIALSHSGWKGTVGHMAEVTMKKMKEAFGTQPEDLLTGIGPSICQECYEVTENVIEEFKAAFPQEEWENLFYQTDDIHYQLNLWYANYVQFIRAGLKPEQISLPGICTCCNHTWLFSHRASKGLRGNLGAFLKINEESLK
ncbi:MAG: peptidoglycan editing factor PgeF [Lachnospiraceae bacterium]|nr:peptidoglycan editing factor PgeF [Lachnospiraceae bacterium]